MEKQRNRSGMILRILFFTFLVTIAGFDLLAVGIGGMNFRLNYLVYLLAFLGIAGQVRFRTAHVNLVLLFVLLALPSMFYSAYFLKSFVYSLWILLSFFVVFGIFSYFSGKEKKTIFLAVIYSYRIQILAALALYMFGFQNRGALLYYEPSYFALSLIIYSAIVAAQVIGRGVKTALPDMLLLLAALVLTKSATMIVALFVVFVVAFFSVKFSYKRTLYAGISIVLIIFSASMYAQFSEDLLSRTLKGIIFSGDLPKAAGYLSARGGNRVPRMAASVNVFKEYPVFGVGLGAYDSHIGMTGIEKYYTGPMQEEVAKAPPVNIYLELLSTVGIAGAIPLFMLFLMIAVSGRGLIKDEIDRAYYIGVISFLIMLAMEANYLRPYFWMMLGLFYGALNEKKPEKAVQ